MSIGRKAITNTVKKTKAERITTGANIRFFNAGGFQQNITVLNFTNEVIYIKSQGNAPYALNSIRDKVQGSIHQPHIEIKVSNGVSGNRDFSETLKLADKALNERVPSSYEAKKLYDKLKTCVETNAGMHHHHGVEDSNFFYVLESEIAASGFAYVKECNLLLSFDDSILLEHHPHSNEAWSAPDVRDYAESRQAAGNMIRVIDNDNIRDHWYYYSARQLVEVTASKDSSKDSGVYFSRLLYNNGVNSIAEEYMNFDEAKERLGLYETKEAALTNGDPERLISAEETQYKLKLEQARREIETLRQQNERQKAMYELEAHQVKVKAEAVKDEIERVSMKRKDKFEDKAAKRKDSFDKKEKKRKNKSEKASFYMKVAETAVKAAPMVIALGALVIGYSVGRGKTSNGLSSSFCDDHGGLLDISSPVIDPTKYGISGDELVEYRREMGLPIYDTYYTDLDENGKRIERIRIKCA